MSSRALDRLIDEMIATIAAEGIHVPREILRAKVAAALWGSTVLDDDGRIVGLVSGQEVDWPPVAN
jgi:hypothetical protein